MANKLTLAFDFNNMAMRALFISSFTGENRTSTFDSDEDCNILVRKIAMDMSYIMRLFMPDRVLVLCDSKNPWRKELYKDLPDEYKGTRVKDDTKNWTKIYETLNEYKKVLKKRGFVVSEISNAEADDLATLWKQKIYIENGDNIVYVTSDRDWVQLIDFNSALNTFCLVYNPIANSKKQKRIFATSDFISWMNAENSSQRVDIFFNNYNPQKDKFKNIFSKDPKITYINENPDAVVLEKVMCGDDSDNVPAFYSYYKNGKKTRITATKMKKIFEDLNISNIDDLCRANKTDVLKESIEKVLKKDLDDIDVNERLIRQRRLVELKPILFPQEICSTFQYHYDDSIDTGYVPINSFSLQDILANTKFLDSNPNKPRENKIFDNIKDLEKYIKPINNSLF